MWNAGAVAGVISEIIAADAKVADFENPSQELRSRLLNAAVIGGNRAFDSLSADWQRQH
jgi:hypothetical protein